MAPAYKLTYFDISGISEPIRYLFKYGNIDFEDNRVDKAIWPSLKQNAPFGQVPFLEHNGKAVNQSLAITRYVAKLVKLVGKDDWEDLEIDSTVDTINDIRWKMADIYFEQNPEKKEKMRQTMLNETVPFYFGRLDAQVKKNNGYLVGGHLTWASARNTSVFLAPIFDVVNIFLKTDLLAKYENLKKVKRTVETIPAIKAWIDVRPEDKLPDDDA